MCMLCKCKMIKNSFTTHVVNYSNSVIIIKNVPCEECEQCGEIFYTDELFCQDFSVNEKIKVGNFVFAHFIFI